VNAVAGPLRGADGRVVATLSITGPSTRLDATTLPRWAPLLIETTDAVSTLLGAPPRHPAG
jgi:DNA-binding IclR family transcriptional regulator